MRRTGAPHRSLERLLIEHSLSVAFHPAGNPKRPSQRWLATEVLPKSNPRAALFVSAWGKRPRLAVENCLRFLSLESRMQAGG